MDPQVLDDTQNTEETAMKMLSASRALDKVNKDSRQNRSLISVSGTPYSSTPHGTYRVR